MKNKVLSVVLGAFLFIGCGGGGTTGSPSNPSDSNNPSDPGSSSDPIPSIETGTGTYVDSPINGVRYVCGSKTGTTGDTGVAGGFIYEVGKSCLFTINGYGMTSIAAANLKEGIEVRPNHEVARYLQSLDKDGNPDNGIEIHADVVQALADKGINGLQQEDIQVQMMVAALSDVDVYGGSYKTMNQAAEHLAGFSVDLTADKSSYTLGDRVVFNASITGNSEGLTYAWSKSGTPYADNGNSLIVDNFNLGLHTIDLNVTKNNISIIEHITIRINEIPNSSPVSNAGDDITATFGTMFTFDGSGSTDSDGTIVRYEWIYPADDNLVMNDSASPKFDKNASILGDHTVILKVTDNQGATDQDTIIVHVVE